MDFLICGIILWKLCQIALTLHFHKFCTNSAHSRAFIMRSREAIPNIIDDAAEMDCEDLGIEIKPSKRSLCGGEKNPRDKHRRIKTAISTVHAMFINSVNYKVNLHFQCPS